jgi:nucleotide-binding universal stress UspA family protein
LASGIKSILFVTDLSPSARHAFDYVCRMAGPLGASIIILHVMEEAAGGVEKRMVAFLGEKKWRELTRTSEQETRRILIGKKRQAELIRNALGVFSESVRVDSRKTTSRSDKIVVSRGKVVPEILKAAERCDLIVMGYGAPNILESAAGGSAAFKVIKRSRIPVLLVPSPEEN